MVKLKPDALRAFLTHSAQLTCSKFRKAVNFFKCLLVCKRYLEFSQWNDIYQLHIRPAPCWDVDVSVKYAHHSTPTRSFTVESAKRLIKFLNPCMLYAIFDGWTTLPTIRSLLNSSTGKMSLSVRDDVHEGSNLINEFHSRVAELECNSHMILDDGFPILKLDFLYAHDIGSMSQFNNLMRHNIKQLKLYFRYRDEFKAFVLSPSDGSIQQCPTLKHVDVRYPFIDYSITQRFTNGLMERCPKLERFEMHLHRGIKVDPCLDEELIRLILAEYKLVQRFREQYSGKVSKITLDWNVTFWYDETLGSDWLKTVAEHERLKNSMVETSSDTNYKSIQIDEEDSSFRLNLYVQVFHF